MSPALMPAARHAAMHAAWNAWRDDAPMSWLYQRPRPAMAHPPTLRQYLLRTQLLATNAAALLALCAAALLAGCASGPVDERTPQPHGWADCKRNPYCSSLTGPQWDHRKHTPPYPLPTLPAAAARDQGQGNRAQR